MWYLLAALALFHAAAFIGWTRFTRREVQVNDADINANGSQDNLRKGYHERRNNIRLLTGAGLLLVASVPALWLGPLACVLSLAQLAALLGGYFERFFTPWLNLARAVRGRADLTEFTASADSASWPDAAAWKPLRAANPTLAAPALQAEANADLRRLLVGIWRACLVAYTLGWGLHLLFYFL